VQFAVGAVVFGKTNKRHVESTIRYLHENLRTTIVLHQVLAFTADLYQPIVVENIAFNTTLDQPIEELAALDRRAADLRIKTLASLPSRLNYADIPALIAALQAIHESLSTGPTPKNDKRRKRAVVTDAIRAEVKDLFNKGKTNAEISDIVGISAPTVQNIKKAWGLVKAPKEKSESPSTVPRT
jgi:hypothetical protein